MRGYCALGHPRPEAATVGRGRVHRHNRRYRTTRGILWVATLLYRTRLSDDDDMVQPDLYTMPTELVPQLIALTSGQD